MPRYLIAYDGSSKDTDYNKLEDKLVELKAKHIQLSVWGVRSDETASTIFQNLWPILNDPSNSLIVVPADNGVEEHSIEMWADV